MRGQAFGLRELSSRAGEQERDEGDSNFGVKRQFLPIEVWVLVFLEQAYGSHCDNGD